EDGIRYRTVTEVQTCPLPIYPRRGPANYREYHGLKGVFFAPHLPFGRWRGGRSIDRRLSTPAPSKPLVPKVRYAVLRAVADRAQIGRASCRERVKRSSVDGYG